MCGSLKASFKELWWASISAVFLRFKSFTIPNSWLSQGRWHWCSSPYWANETKTFDDFWSSNYFMVLILLIDPNQKINFLLILCHLNIYPRTPKVIVFGYKWQQWSLVLAVSNLQAFSVVSFESSANTNVVYKAPPGSGCCLTYMNSGISVNFCPFFLEALSCPRLLHMQVPLPETLLPFPSASHSLSQTQCISEGHWKYPWAFKSSLQKFLNCLFLLMMS